MLSRPIRVFKVSLMCNNRNNTIGKFIQFTFTIHLMLPTFSLECLIKCDHVSEKRPFINDFLKHYCSHFPDFSSAKRSICGCNIKKKSNDFLSFIYPFFRESVVKAERNCGSWNFILKHFQIIETPEWSFQEQVLNGDLKYFMKKSVPVVFQLFAC